MNFRETEIGIRFRRHNSETIYTKINSTKASFRTKEEDYARISNNWNWRQNSDKQLKFWTESIDIPEEEEVLHLEKAK